MTWNTPEAKLPLRIVTFFWDDPKAKHKQNYDFSVQHVNKLARAFKKHLRLPHEFVCITDNPDGIDVGLVRIVPLWDEFKDLGRCFVRLGVYSNIMRELIGPRFACIDLDVVITGDVTEIFDRNEPFVGYRDSKNPRCYSGCFYMMDAGAKEQVYNSFRRLYNMIPSQHRMEHFRQHYNRYSELVGSDQSWQSEIIGDPDRPDAPPRWTWEQKVWDYWNVEELPLLPEDTRMVFINGLRRDASMPAFQKKHEWIRDHWVNI